MVVSEAMYMLERLNRGWSVSDKQLADAECILSDMLESVQVVRRQRSQSYDMLTDLCQEPLSPEPAVAVPM